MKLWNPFAISNIKTISRSAPSSELPLNVSETLPTIASGDKSPLGWIDRYELLEELGGGAFGVVFRARDTIANIEVAVKGLPPLVQYNRDELKCVRENFALISRLHHPHIASALVLHQVQNFSYADPSLSRKLHIQRGDYLFVMTYAAGITLSQWQRQFPDKRVPVAKALDICRQIAEALDYAHSQQIIHRDIKPSNIMVETLPGDRLFVRVLDFGLAAEIRSSISRLSGETAAICGTRPYMAPEQWQGIPQSPQTDQYALAVLFYELVSGAVPFHSAFETGDVIIMENAVLRMRPPPLGFLRKSQNAALQKALSKNPALRFKKCEEFINALSRDDRDVLSAIAYLILAVMLSATGYVGWRYFQQIPEDVRTQTEKARQAAQDLNAHLVAPHLWGQAQNNMEAAEQAFRENRFDEARTLWGKAKTEFEQALFEVLKSSAEAVRRLAEEARGKAQGVAADRLAPNPWNRGQENIKAAEQAFRENRFDEAREHWEKAIKDFKKAGDDSKVPI